MRRAVARDGVLAAERAGELCHASFLAEHQAAPGTVPLRSRRADDLRSDRSALLPDNNTLLVPDPMFGAHARVAGWRRRDVGDGPRVHDVVRVGRIFEKVEPEQQRDERALPARLEVARLQKEPPSVLWRCR
mgnify:CR=1 FL=1